jgi:hypothetical protein
MDVLSVFYDTLKWGPKPRFSRWRGPEKKGNAMPTYITLGNLRIAGVAAMGQGKGSWTCQSALGRRRRSCRSADAPPRLHNAGSAADRA